MKTYKVTLTQRIKSIRLAESASEAVKAAMDDVAEPATPFVPENWTVKEEQGEQE